MGAGPNEIERRIEQQRREVEPKIRDLKHQVAEDLSSARHEATDRIRDAGAASAAIARGARGAVNGVFHMDTRNALLARLVIGFAVGFASRVMLPEHQAHDERMALTEGQPGMSISP